MPTLPIQGFKLALTKKYKSAGDWNKWQTFYFYLKNIMDEWKVAQKSRRLIFRPLPASRAVRKLYLREY
jgi:hypothetical protein